MHSSTQNTRRMFEELISHHYAEVERDSPMVKRAKGGKIINIGQQRVKAKRPRFKPDSVLHKLLERFDPPLIQ